MTRTNPRVRVASPKDNPDWKVGDSYLWPDDWPLEFKSFSLEELAKERKWLKRDKNGNFVEVKAKENTYLEFAIDPSADTKYPTKGTPHSAGYDIATAEDITVPPGKVTTISTGLKVLLPYGTYGQLQTRSLAL